MRDFIKVIKAMNDSNRIRIIFALQKRELCVCQITILLNLAPSTVSKHLSILHDARLIDGRKEGRWMFYRLPDKPADTMIKEALNWIIKSASTLPEIKSDKVKLDEILTIPYDVICRKKH